MNKLPNEIINQILLFNYHPVADLLKQAVETVNEEIYEIIEGDYEYGGEDYWHADEMSFADFYFSFEDRDRLHNSSHIYKYCWMDSIYYNTYIEYMRVST